MENNMIPGGARQFAENLAFEAGDLMRGHYRMDHAIQLKADATPVTEVDMLVNQLVLERVQQTFPEHGVLGEEASFNTDAEWLWVCDPIDGTVAFMTRIPTSAFSLALVKNGEVQLGLVYAPFTNELYVAQKGQGAWLGRRQLRVSPRGHQQPAIIKGSGSTTSPYLFIDNPRGVALLKQKGWYTVNFPGIAYTGALIADGALDGVFYTAQYAHDIAAIALLVTEAGGRVTDLNGNPQLYNGQIQGAIVSNGVIHDDLVTIARELRSPA